MSLTKLRELEETILGDNASPDVMAAAWETRASLAHHLLPLAEALEQIRDEGLLACNCGASHACQGHAAISKALKNLQEALA